MRGGECGEGRRVWVRGGECGEGGGECGEGWDITYPTVFIALLKWHFMLIRLPSLEIRNDHIR